MNCQKIPSIPRSLAAAALVGALVFSAGVPSTWGQRASDISDILSSEGRVYYGQAPNSIMVVDYPENIARIEQYLKMVDVPPRQVLIEARVVEVKLQGQHALGINWSLFAEKNGYDMGQFLVSGSTVGSAISQNIPYKNTAYPPGSTSATNETPFTITIFDENINVVVQTLANAMDTNILSAPRVTALNNEEAEIRVVEELRWVTPEVQSEEGTVSITWSEADDSPRNVGISLRVRPTITDDGNILMELHPEVSEHVRDIELTAVAGNISVPYTIPIVDTRNADTKVVIGNGQTLIIGGLIKDKSTVGESKIPLLGDIPILGHFFKSSIKTKDKSELLIFVSPTIITPQVTEHMKRMEQAGGAWYLEDRPPPKRRDVPHGVWKKDITALGLDGAENHDILQLNSKNRASHGNPMGGSGSNEGGDEQDLTDISQRRGDGEDPHREEGVRIGSHSLEKVKENNMPNINIDDNNDRIVPGRSKTPSEASPMGETAAGAVRGAPSKDEGRGLDVGRRRLRPDNEHSAGSATEKAQGEEGFGEGVTGRRMNLLPESVVESAVPRGMGRERDQQPLVIEVKAPGDSGGGEGDEIFHEIEALLKSVKRDIEINKALHKQWEKTNGGPTP